jgi:hypothetical protein
VQCRNPFVVEQRVAPNTYPKRADSPRPSRLPAPVLFLLCTSIPGSMGFKQAAVLAPVSFFLGETPIPYVLVQVEGLQASK